MSVYESMYVLVGWLVGWLFRFYGMSTFVGYLMSISFLYK